MAGDLSHGTFSNVETLLRFFATNTLAPWVRKLESEFSRSVFSATSRSTHKLELDLSGLLRGDPAQRWQAWKVAIEAGVLDPDEIREEEGFNPRGAAAPAVNEPEARTRGVNVNITLPERMEHEFRHVDSETAQETRALARALSESTRELAQAQAKPAAPPVVNVNLPARRSVSEIERDLAGDIKRVTQLEHDV